MATHRVSAQPASNIFCTVPTPADLRMCITSGLLASFYEPSMELARLRLAEATTADHDAHGHDLVALAHSSESRKYAMYISIPLPIQHLHHCI